MIRGLPALIVGLSLLYMPAPADAQIEWIRRLSGPEYKPAFFLRAGFCLDKGEEGLRITCGEIGGAVFRSLNGRPRAQQDWDFQVAVAVTRGTDGDNPEAGIRDTRVWVVEPQFRATLVSVNDRPLPFGLVTSAGLGWHTFNGGTTPEKFSRGALILTFGGRFPNPKDTTTWAFWHDGVRNRDRAQVFFEAGFKLRWFPGGLSNAEFGGTSPEDEIGSASGGFYGMVGIRFDR
jgi:hypothetical protein